jgi:hypothetical protein
MNGELSRCAAPSKGLLIKLYPAYSVLAGSAASPLDMRPSTGEFFQQPFSVRSVHQAWFFFE